jgi:hypothetical protein
MLRLRHNRQMTVASVLLFLLAAFAIDPPEHRCRTQSTRNRQSRIVRSDDGDTHSRWHHHGFDDSGNATSDEVPVAVAVYSIFPDPQLGIELLSSDDEYVRHAHHSSGPRRTRPPPSSKNLA